MAADYSVVDPDAQPTEQFPESGVDHAKLTEALGAEEMRVNRVTVDPGEVVGYHDHERQEEIFVCRSGPGEVYVDGDHRNVPEGGVVRVGPGVPRQILNTGSEPVVWIVFGAPPVGTVEDFGEYRNAEGGYEIED